ncbi:hypothetical protein D3C81_1893240 [compost metagenome]
MPPPCGSLFPSGDGLAEPAAEDEGVGDGETDPLEPGDRFGLPLGLMLPPGLWLPPGETEGDGLTAESAGICTAATLDFSPAWLDWVLKGTT